MNLNETWKNRTIDHQKPLSQEMLLGASTYFLKNDIYLPLFFVQRQYMFINLEEYKKYIQNIN